MTKLRTAFGLTVWLVVGFGYAVLVAVGKLFKFCKPILSFIIFYIRWPFCAVLLYIVKFLVILDAGWDRYVAWRKGESAE